MSATIWVNGEPEPLRAATVYGLLVSKAIDPDNKGIAVALNGKVLSRAAWTDTPLTPGDRVEIVTAFAGG